MWCHLLIWVLVYNELKLVSLMSAQHGVEDAWGATGLGSEMVQGTLEFSCAPPQLLPLGLLVHVSSGEALAIDCRRVRVRPSLVPQVKEVTCRVHKSCGK